MARPKERSAEFDSLAAPSTGSPARVAVRLRSGAGKHDTRPKDQRTRSGRERAALRDQGAA